MHFRSLSKQDNELLTRIDEVLHYLWDPIGVSGVPEARDEYTSYAGVVFGMVKQGAEAAEISAYLRKIRVVDMGMGQHDDRGDEDEIAEITINWKDAILDE